MRQTHLGTGGRAPRVPEEFAALLEALRMQDASREGLKRLDDAAWGRLLDFCDLAHLSLVLAQTPLEDYPEWVGERLRRSLSENARRQEFVTAAYQEAAAALDQAGIPHIVLKGMAQSPDYVPEPRLRYQSDLDLFIAPGQASRAQAALEAIGYRPEEKMNVSMADHLPTLERRGAWEWRGNAYDPEMPPSIELHIYLWNQKAHVIGIPEVDDFAERRVTRISGGCSISTLHPADYLAYFALHILRGILTGEWVIHHLYELACFLDRREGDRSFWSEWQGRHSARLRRLQLLAVALAVQHFSCHVAPALRDEMEAMPAAWRRWMEKLGGSALEVMFRRSKNGRVLHLLLAESWSERSAVLRRAFLPVGVSGVRSPAVRIRNRRMMSQARSSLFPAYLSYLCNRSREHVLASIAFLLRTAWIGLPESLASGEFRRFLAAGFFLTWACRFTFSSSIWR